MFVEGPGGVGKRYFIDNFAVTYKDYYPHSRVNVINSKDTVQQARNKLSPNTSPSYKANCLYNAHLNLLRVVNAALSRAQAGDLVVVSGGFIHTVHHNLANLTVAEEASSYISSYIQEFVLAMYEVQTLLVRLDVTLEQKSVPHTDKPTWLETIYSRYRSTPKELTDMFTHCAVAIPTDHDSIFRRYF